MTTMDYAAIVGIVLAALASVLSFALIANHLFDHGLADRNNPRLNLLEFYRKYKRHTSERTGQVNPLFWIHAVAAGTFIVLGVAYTLARFIFKWTF
jgi:hypothetical protein